MVSDDLPRTFHRRLTSIHFSSPVSHKFQRCKLTPLHRAGVVDEITPENGGKMAIFWRSAITDETVQRQVFATSV